LPTATISQRSSHPLSQIRIMHRNIGPRRTLAGAVIAR
jgi:hypothetical protein